MLIKNGAHLKLHDSCAPQGVVRVHILEARDLVAKDTYMMGLVKGKSDPYVTLRVGNRHFKTKTIKENLHPKWNEVYEVEQHNHAATGTLWFYWLVVCFSSILEYLMFIPSSMNRKLHVYYASG